MIVLKVFLSILNQMDFHLDQNWNENCHHYHIPFNLKGNRILVFSVCAMFLKWAMCEHSPPNSTPRRFQHYLLLTNLLYFLFIFYLSWCTLPNFSSVSSQGSLPFLSCYQTTTPTAWYLIFSHLLLILVASPQVIFYSSILSHDIEWLLFRQFYVYKNTAFGIGR